MRHEGGTQRQAMEFRLVVRLSRAQGWHAWVTGPDATEREFASPFELARFLAWPMDRMPGSPDGGIR